MGWGEGRERKVIRIKRLGVCVMEGASCSDKMVRKSALKGGFGEGCSRREDRLLW